MELSPVIHIPKARTKSRRHFKLTRWVENKLSLKAGSIRITPSGRVVLATALGIVAIPSLAAIEILHMYWFRSFETNTGIALASTVSFVVGVFTGKSFSL